MSSKATATRERIVERAAKVFNLHGYAATSMAVLLDEVGLRKGGLYNHFASKEQLAVESLDFAVRCVSDRFETALAATTSAPERLRAVVAVMGGLVRDPALPGGCPVMRTAIESVEGHPALRERAQQAMTRWQRLVGRIVKDGIAAGEIRATVDPRQVATVLTATLEGAVMLALLLDDPKQLRRVEKHLDELITSITEDLL